MKFCKDCCWCIGGPGMPEPYKCIALGAAPFRNPVNGEFIDAIKMRIEDYRFLGDEKIEVCGLDGKWFGPRESK